MRQVHTPALRRASVAPACAASGQAWRVAIRRALANESVLIVADKPTASLDTQRGAKVMTMLRQIAHERRSAVIAVTDDHRMIEGFDSVYHREDGRLARVDHHEEVDETAPPEVGFAVKKHCSRRRFMPTRLRQACARPASATCPQRG
jgi:ABC-type lipoprotein export system ATPase subunit